MLLCATCLVFCTPVSQAERLTIAVASNFKTSLEHLLDHYPDADSVQIIAGSSGKLYAQIRRGAPYDVFLSADRDKPLRLIDEGYALANSFYEYALGELVLWTSHQGSIETVLQQTQRLAIANPRLAPYGKAAATFLQAHQFASEHIVYAENIAQAFQFRFSGHADSALIAGSQASSIASGRLIRLTSHQYPDIVQSAVIISASRHHAAANDFMQFLRSDRAQSLIVEQGYLDQNRQHR